MKKNTRKKIRSSFTYKKRNKNNIKTKKYKGGGQEYKSYNKIRNLIKPDYTVDNKFYSNYYTITSFIPLTTSYMNGLKLINKSIGLIGLYIDNFYKLGEHNVINNIFPNKVCSDLFTDYICNTKIKDLLSNEGNKGDTLPEELKVVENLGVGLRGGNNGSCSYNKFCYTHDKVNNLNIKGSSLVKKTLKTLESFNLYKTSDGHYKYMSLLHKYTISELVSLLSIYKFVSTQYKTYDKVEETNEVCKIPDDEYTETTDTEAPKQSDFVNIIGPFKKVNGLVLKPNEVKDLLIKKDDTNIQEILLELLNLFDSCLNLNYYGIYPDSVKTENDKREFEGLCSIKCPNCTVYSQSKIQHPEKNNVDIILSHIFYLMYNYYKFKKYKLREDTILNNIYNMHPGNNFYKSKNERLKFNKKSIPLFIKELKLQYPETSSGITIQIQKKIRDYFDAINLPLYVCKMILYKVYTKQSVDLFA